VFIELKVNYKVICSKMAELWLPQHLHYFLKCIYSNLIITVFEHSTVTSYNCLFPVS